MDLARDDSLIYERMLREDSGVCTGINNCCGVRHGFWTMYLDLAATQRRIRDAVDGVRWLLGDT